MVRRSIRMSVALAASAAVALSPVAGTALAAPPVAQAPAAVQAPAATGSVVLDPGARSLGLQGVANARDLGGYRTTDGRAVRTGLVFRTGALNKATDADLATLTDDRLRIIDDLRTQPERMLSPDRVPAGVIDNSDDIIGSMSPQSLAAMGSPESLLGQFAGGAASPGLYRAFITSPGASQGFANVIHDIIDTGNGAVLYHCSAGQDRTGWESAVLLTILGVDRSTVTYDYLLSNHYHNNPGAVSLDEINGAFDQVQQTYGSFDNYVHQGLKLTNGDVAALQAKLLS